MSEWTITLKEVMETMTGKTRPVLSTELTQLMEEARPILFPDFPIYDESHRTELENRIMETYMFREISCTPYAQWQMLFNNKMYMVMEKYNPLYKTLADGVDLFDDTNYTRTYQEDANDILDRTQDTSTEGNSSDTSNSVFQPGVTTVDTHNETPQSSLDDFLNDKYLNSADKTVQSGKNVTDSYGESEGTSTSNTKQTDKNVRDLSANETYKGKRFGKSYGELLVEYKNNIFSVDQLIVEELDDMFFCIY